MISTYESTVTDVYHAYYAQPSSNHTIRITPNCSSIPQNAFYRDLSITQIFAKSCTTVNTQAFSSCSNLTKVVLPACVSVASYAFTGCTNLNTVIFPNCEYIGSSAFYIAGIKNISLENCSYIGTSAFYSCSLLEEVSIPNCTGIGASAFTGCNNLKTIYAPNLGSMPQLAYSISVTGLSITIGGVATVTSNNTNLLPNSSTVSDVKLTILNCQSLTDSAFTGRSCYTELTLPECSLIGSYAFSGCTNLKYISIPKCTSISGYGFYGRTKLSNLSIPMCEYIGPSAFYNCQSLTEMNLSKCKRMFSGAFLYCANLATVTLCDYATYLYSSTFQNCYNLRSLYLLGSSCISLSNSYVFSSTPIAGYWDTSYCTQPRVYGSIYVRASLLNTYKNAWYWSYFSNRFVGIDRKVIISGATTNTVGYLNGELITDFQNTSPVGNVTYEFYNPVWGKRVYSYTENELTGTSTYNLVAQTNYKTVTYSGISSTLRSKITKVRLSYDNVTFDMGTTYPVSLGVPAEGAKVTIEINFDGNYADIVRTDDITSTRTITLSDPKVVKIVTVDSTNASSYTTLVDGSNFEVSGGYIRSGSSSYNKNDSSSVGYIKFKTPEVTNANMKITVVCHCSSEQNYDFGYITVDSTNKYPARSSTAPENCIFSSVINNSTTDGTYTFNMSSLQGNTDYYINISYKKDSSQNTGEDRLMIKSISFYCQ